MKKIVSGTESYQSFT